MYIYTVRPGDSLWSISQKYNTPIQSIAAANDLTPPYQLVIGQSLVVPTVARRHTVKAGESLWSISRLYNVSVNAIADANQLPAGGYIIPGQILVIPAESNMFGSTEVNAYIEPVGAPEREMQDFLSVAQYLTYLTIFSYRAQENGSIISPPNAERLVAAARQRGVAPLMCLTNFRGGTFDSDLAHAILSSPTVSDTLINNVLQIMRSQRYYGVNVDFERVPPRDRDLYTNFLRKMRDRIKPEGFQLSTALAPKISATQVGDWYEAHDYGGHGAIVDFTVLMTYEWGWSGGPPLPVAPINEVKRVLDYAVTVIPRNKIMMGMPLYGYDWALPYIPKGQFARRISPQAAVERALRYGARIMYDQRAESPFYRYFDSNRNEHIVWFEDARSVYAKFQVINQYRLRGPSYWVLGEEFPQNWVILEDMFNIRKLNLG